jgi:hypothetical protein
MRAMVMTFGALFAFDVLAHDAPAGWRYDAYCCNGNEHSGDCQQIPSKTVRIVRGGYQLTIAPGDHRLVTRAHVFKFPQRSALRSPDSEYHLCLFPNEDTPRCFYAPDMSY